MKKREKLELNASLILQTIVLSYLYFSFKYFGFENLTPPIFILWLLSVTVTSGAYFQTIKRSSFGFYQTLFGAVLFVLYTGVLGFLVLYAGASILFLIALAIPSIISSAVAVFAVWSLD